MPSDNSSLLQANTTRMSRLKCKRKKLFYFSKEFPRSRRAISNDSIANQSTMLTTLSLATERSTPQILCIEWYYCYNQNNTNETFVCQKYIKK
jgi:hypothetical protein